MRFVQGKRFEDYLADELLRSAVERQLEVVGEALNQLRKVDPATAAQLPGLAKAVALRNVLIQAYATVNDRLVWGVVEQDLAPLLEGGDAAVAGRRGRGLNACWRLPWGLICRLTESSHARAGPR